MQLFVPGAFRESEEGYRLLFENNPHAMWIYDRESLAFLAVNDAAIERYGYSRDEFLRMTLKDIRPAQDIPWLLERVSLIRPGMNSASGRHLRKDGTLFDVEIVSHTLGFEGRRAELVLAMATDGEHRAALAPTRFSQHEMEANDAVETVSDNELTDAERRIAFCVARGFSNKQIARVLDISVRTVENHVSHILIKKGFENRVQLARYVLQLGNGAPNNQAGKKTSVFERDK